jgi:hypothetical protein
VNRNQIFTHLKGQANFYRILDDHLFEVLKNAVYDERWEPKTYGYLPAFIHEWRKQTKQNMSEANYEYYYYLILCKVPDLKARFKLVLLKLFGIK